MLIDFHVHLYDEAGYGEALAETAKNLGLDRLCIGGGEPRYGLASNAAVHRLADEYPELFIAFACIRPDRDGPGEVEQLKRLGFEGLRISAPALPYDDERYFPIYEAAAALQMPVIVHTGFLVPTRLDRTSRVRVANMRPVHLDTIARWFPELKLVGVALGRPWYEEAVETMRHNPNVFFDLSGDTFRVKGPEFLADLLRPTQDALWEDSVAGDLCGRIVFGSATRYTEIASVERDYQRACRAMGLVAEDIEAIMGNTAARLLGIAQEEEE